MVFKKSLSVIFLSSMSVASFGNGLELPGERYIWGSEGVKCEAFGDDVALPESLEALGVELGEISTNSSQLAAKISSSFTEGETTCVYEGLYRVNPLFRTITQFDSAAFATEGESDCSAGKEYLDTYFAGGTFERWGDDPYHLTIFVRNDEAASICGPNATRVGFDFVYVGEI
ncbi:MAG: hypothetical protein HRU19_07065 [Pseudobacteriovorax sp.]|nr:hypothetical protein [Pseudobacteriovorax sp.]